MNEQMLFQRMDYMSNPNLVFEENTLYEMDPNCMRQREQDDVTPVSHDLKRDGVRNQENELEEAWSKLLAGDEEQKDEAGITLKQDETVSNVYFQEGMKNRDKKPGLVWWLLLLLFLRSQ